MSVHSSLYYPDPTKLFPSLRGPPDSSYSRSQTCGFQNSYSKDNSGLNPARDPAVMAFRRTLRPHKKGLALHWTGDEETFLPLLASTPCQHSQQDWIVIFPNTRVFSNRVRKRLGSIGEFPQQMTSRNQKREQRSQTPIQCSSCTHCGWSMLSHSITTRNPKGQTPNSWLCGVSGV